MVRGSEWRANLFAALLGFAVLGIALVGTWTLLEDDGWPNEEDITEYCEGVADRHAAPGSRRYFIRLSDCEHMTEMDPFG